MSDRSLETDEDEAHVDPLESSWDKVVDKATFLEFVRELYVDRERATTLTKAHPENDAWGSPDSGGWYNHDIASYLEAAYAWGQNATDDEERFPSAPSWQNFATFLWMGKHYE